MEQGPAPGASTAAATAADAVVGRTAAAAAAAAAAAPGGNSSSGGSGTRKRTGTSKYDLVKVRVWIGQSHHYVLSRFLICRTLMATQIPYVKATKISILLKKHFVDGGRRDVSQAELEAALFSLLQAKAWAAGPHTGRLYRLMSEFFSARHPLVVLIIGPPASGKSSLAQALSSRLNMTHVVASDEVARLLMLMQAPEAEAPQAAEAEVEAGVAGARQGSAGAEAAASASADAKPQAAYGSSSGIDGGGCASSSAAEAPCGGSSLSASSSSSAASSSSSSDTTAIAHFLRVAALVHQGLRGEIAKAVSDGKPVVIEGTYLDPGLWCRQGRGGAGQQDDQSGGGGTASGLLPPRSSSSSSSSSSSTSADAEPVTSGQRAPAACAPPPAWPLVVPFVLTMSDRDRAIMMEEKLGAASTAAALASAGAGQAGAPPSAAAAGDACRRAAQLQAYLQSYATATCSTAGDDDCGGCGGGGVQLVPVRFGHFDEAAHAMHEHVLRTISTAMAATEIGADALRAPTHAAAAAADASTHTPGDPVNTRSN